MGHPPLSAITEIVDLRVWLSSRGIRKVEDIAEWDINGNWQRWRLPIIPAHLKKQLTTLTDAITDFTPMHKDEDESWGWGKTGVYTVRQGYLQMQGKKASQHPETVWKQIWEYFSIPKINFFFWTLFHNKILTGDNL